MNTKGRAEVDCSPVCGDLGLEELLVDVKADALASYLHPAAQAASDENKKH